MIFVAKAVLSKEEVKVFRETLQELRFIDGKTTASGAAGSVKNNLQLEKGAGLELKKQVHVALRKHKTFAAAVIPHRIGGTLISRYEAGMQYGWHTDSPVMGTKELIRTDVSFTLFLSEPDEYEGGELVLKKPMGEQKVKLSAGSAIVYPSRDLHRVAEVTAGIREVVAGWAQSRIRNPHQREILYELSTAMNALYNKDGKTEIYDGLAKCRSNLMREWVEL